MAGYIRVETYTNGDTIKASDTNNEFDALVTAFNAASGHTHDGTAAEGGPVTNLGPAQDVTISSTQVLPKTDDTVDLGSATKQFKDLYVSQDITMGGGGYFHNPGMSSGIENEVIGLYAMSTSGSGRSSTAIGSYALNNNTASFNTAVGAHCMRTGTALGEGNTGIGAYVLYNYGVGKQNSCLGYYAGYSIGGSYNTLLGSYAGYSGTYSDYCTAVGHDALYTNSTGDYNVAVGADAGRSCGSGSRNTILGNQSNSLGGYSPVLDIVSEDDRIVMGSTSVTNAYIQVAWTVVSDERDKMNFSAVPHGLDFVKQLNPIQFQFKESRESDVAHGPVRYGFKAQEILALEGDSPVIIDNENPDKLRYNGESLVPVLVKAIQEQQAIIDSLQSRLDAAGL